MNYAYHLIPTVQPSVINCGGVIRFWLDISEEEREALGWLPLLRDMEDAPLGYAAPVEELRDGRKVAVQYALGTPEERAAESLRQWREETCVDAWKARYILEATPKMETGGLANFPGETLLEQLDSFTTAVLARSPRQKYKGVLTWCRADPMLQALAETAGMDDLAIDAWFRAASEVQ